MPSAPEKVFRRLLDLMLKKNMDAVADLWAADGIAEFPFAVGDAPRRLAGREEVRDYLAGYPELLDMREAAALTVRPTEDTDTAVIEWTAEGRTVRTGERYRLDYVVVLTVREERITVYRDYWSPLATARAAGRLPELIASLERDAAS
ncbi:nuclear transport factor 2 family protein [Nonomuraea fuscirosea]